MRSTEGPTKPKPKVHIDDDEIIQTVKISAVQSA